jgi:peptidoglycan hydrolase-like protein with peptidoglycan-binding domain
VQRKAASAVVALALTCGIAMGVPAVAGAEVKASAASKRSDIRALQRKVGVAADGVFGPMTERAVKRFQRRHDLVPDGIVGPLTRAALGLRPFSARSVRRTSSVTLPLVLRRIAECESGGNPRAISPGGTYRGKYQFSRDTWRNLGGTGDPADAPEWLQDRLALKLYRQAGTAPWPNCA